MATAEKVTAEPGASLRSEAYQKIAATEFADGVHVDVCGVPYRVTQRYWGHFLESVDTDYYNDEAFLRIGIDDERISREFAAGPYGYTTTSGTWPFAKIGDYPALKRLCLALQEKYDELQASKGTQVQITDLSEPVALTVVQGGRGISAEARRKLSEYASSRVRGEGGRFLPETDWEEFSEYVRGAKNEWKQAALKAVAQIASLENAAATQSRLHDDDVAAIHEHYKQALVTGEKEESKVRFYLQLALIIGMVLGAFLGVWFSHAFLPAGGPK